MKNKIYKSILSFFLIIIFLCSMISPVYGTTEEDKLMSNLETFFEKGHGEHLIQRKDFYHMDFVNLLREDGRANAAMIVLDVIYGVLDGADGEPTEDKYMEVLINIMSTYESENAADIAEQYKLDNQKTAVDYIYDAEKLGISLAGIAESTKPLEQLIQSAMNQIITITDNSINSVNAISNVQTVIGNYAKHDAFLALMEEEGNDNLKSAAATLRNCMQEAIKIKLDAYAEVSAENLYNNITSILFDDFLWEQLENSDLYLNNSAFKRFVNIGNKVNYYLGPITLGMDIGKFLGNISVAGENALYSFLEMKAIYDISEILESKLEYYHQNYDSAFSDSVGDMVESYVNYGNYLINCRIRGEYCFYSLYADRGIVDYDETAELAKNVYCQLVERLTDLKENLDKLLNTDIIEISEYFYKRDEFVELLIMDALSEEKHNISPESVAYVKDGLSIEWLDDIFSINNNGNAYVKLYDIVLGDSLEVAEEKLFSNGWVSYWQYENTYEYCAIIDNRSYYLSVTVGENNEVLSWYLNNWPEGDHISNFLDELMRAKNPSLNDWESFLSSREYELYIDTSENSMSLEYVLYDINADGVSELLIENTVEAPFYTTWVFAFNGYEIELVYERYGYGQFRYSPNYNCVLISPETKPFGDTSVSPFYQLDGVEFKHIFTVIQDMGENFYSDEFGRKSISDDERKAYFLDAVYFEWKPI